ncbi:hypothetical protein M8818_005324 [Zalaria obscura]|uniref:Uncharacterized protein n=1 Tax=Zalaria obscura TaxID=2024903 RepID=A0ACC3SA47_9PEZI
MHEVRAFQRLQRLPASSRPLLRHSTTLSTVHNHSTNCFRPVQHTLCQDPEFYGAPEPQHDWQYATPSATPTTHAFDQTVYHTPKHFQDAFGTPHGVYEPSSFSTQYTGGMDMMQDFNNDMGMGGQFQNGQPNQFMTMNMSQEFLPNSQPQNNVPVSAPASRAEGGYQMNQTAPPTNQLLESFQNMRPMDGPQFQAPYHHRTTSAGVNPSLVYSSPVTHRPSPPKQMRPSSRASMTEVERRFPYEHQLQESKREMDNMRSKRSRQQQFPPRTDSLGALPNIPSRPGVSRSNTIDGSRPMSLHVDTDIASMLSRSNTTASIPRKSSPLKRTNTRTSLSSISETPQPRYPRTSVFLTVDANGTARTETRVIDESPTKSVKQRSPTGSVKQKYPNLWDDSDSESDTNSEANRDAFTFPNRHERSSKMARLDPSLENLEGLKLPRSNSSASLRTPSKAAISAAAQLRRQNSARKSRPTRFNSQSGRRDTLASLNGSFVDLASMNIEDDRSPNGDAGNAIRGLVESRSFSQDQPIQPDPFAPAPGPRPRTRAAASRLCSMFLSWSLQPQRRERRCEKQDKADKAYKEGEPFSDPSA